MLTSFLTGSYAYGDPTPESDIDLVVYMDRDDAGKLLELSDLVVKAPEYWEIREDCTSVAARFSKLNVLIFFELDEFLAWKEATEELKGRIPNPTRSDAVDLIKRKVAECRKL